jgi:hypothetical protein
VTAQRKLRSALTAIAVLLGVAVIAGTYVLTDQIRNGFNEMIPSPGEFFYDWWKNAGYEGVARAMASRLMARDADEILPVPRRPHVHGRMGATARSRTPRHRG